MRIITVNLPLGYIRAIKGLTGEGGLYPSRSELIRVAVREFLIQELKAAKSFIEFQEQLKNAPFTAPAPPKNVEDEEEKFELDIDDILGIPEKKYKTQFEMNFQRVPTMKPPSLDKTGCVVDMGNRIKIDGKVFNVK